jgi:uracil-DNA glycosylase
MSIPLTGTTAGGAVGSWLLPAPPETPFEAHMSNILIIGEAWGEQEARERSPFVGPSGYELTRMLHEAGIRRADCYLTNVFNIHPPGNDLSALCGPVEDALDGYPKLLTPRPTYQHWRGGYARARLGAELTRLSAELLEQDPNLVIALGATAMWAMLGKTTITKLRGTTALSTHTVAGFKVLPTFHPAAVLRQWELRPTTVIDLSKAHRESAFPEIRRPEVTIYVPETPDEIRDFDRAFIREASSLAIDIETSGSQITCIGFAPGPTTVLVVPIHDRRRPGGSYWSTPETEQAVWSLVREICHRPKPQKVFQNGLYDIAFLWRSKRIAVAGATHDTMLLHHALQPESLKGLGFLGSVYAGDHGAWKSDRIRTKTIKRDQ